MKEGKTMTRRGLALGRQLAAFAALAVLALSLSGDRTSAAGVPATVYGQDPLEVLELKVRPNVIVVLDSSGSMQWLQNENDYAQSGDHPRSKLYLAKQVLREIIQNNQEKISIQMGTYTQYGMGFPDRAAGENRFQYVVSGTDASFMGTASDELRAERADGDDSGTNRGLQSWQIIYPEWNRIYFEESNGAVCSGVLSGTFPRFYATGSDLADGLETAMNGATCTGTRGNTYAVTYATATGRFMFEFTGTNQFRLLPGSSPNNIANALGGLTTAWSAGGSATTITPTVTQLRRRTGSTRVYTPTQPGVSVGDTCTITGADPTVFNGTWTVSEAWDGFYFRLSGPTGTEIIATTIGTVTCTHIVVAAVTPRSSNPYTLLYRTTGTGNSGSLATPFSNGMDTYWSFSETISGTSVTFYQVATSRLWNGEVIRVNADNEVCGMDFATAATKTNPPSVTLQSADSSCSPGTNRAVFTFAGAQEANNSASCLGYRSKSQLIPCDLQSPPAATQFTKIGPYLDLELPFAASGDPADWDGDGYADYAEKQDGSWEGGSMTASGWTDSVKVAPSAKASGNTPIANSLIDIKGTANASDYDCVTNAEAIYPTLDLNSGSATTDQCPERGFTRMWNTGLSTGPWAGVPAAQRAIKNHLDPKEKTIVLFVTDGNDTCGSRDDTDSSSSYANYTGSGAEDEARRAAYYAELLYKRIDALEPASSVQTYVIGYGGSFSASDPYLLNLIAWGGSGLGQGLAGQPDVNWKTDSESTLRTERAKCTTCTDAFFAPDAATLAAQLQAIIDQGASYGDFTAQQSITESVFEYVDVVPGNDARSPSSRYTAIVPTRFVSSFTLPGFQGQLKAYQNDGSGNSVQMWSAGDKLRQLVTFGDSNGTACTTEGMCSCDTSTVGGALTDCVMTQLHGGATDATIASSAAKIKRRIYTTTRNGVYSFDPATLMAGTSAERITLWPPASGVLPTDYTSAGPLRRRDGVPPRHADGVPHERAPAGYCTSKTYDQVLARRPPARLQGLPRHQPARRPARARTSTTKMRAARREARDIILAFLAGPPPSRHERSRPQAHVRGLSGAPRRSRSSTRPATGSSPTRRWRRRRSSPRRASASRRRRPTWTSTSSSGTARATRTGRTSIRPATRSARALASPSRTTTRPSASGDADTRAGGEAGHDRRLRPRQRHAPRVPGGAELQPGVLELQSAHGELALRRERRRGAVGLRALRPARGGPPACGQRAAGAGEPRVHARPRDPLRRRVRARGDDEREHRQRDRPGACRACGDASSTSGAASAAST